MHRRQQVVVCVIPLLFLGLSLLLWRHGTWTTLQSHLSSGKNKACTRSLDWLQDLDLAYPISFSRRDIVVQSTSNDKRPESITNVPEILFPSPKVFDFTEGSSFGIDVCSETLKLQAPKNVQSNFDPATLLFGLSANITELEASIPRLARWLAGSRSKLIVMLPADGGSTVNPLKSLADQKEDLESRFRERNMTVEIIESPKEDLEARRIPLALLKYMYDTREQPVQWMSIIDSRTFFPSFGALTAMLSRYNPLEQHYVGGLPEEWWTVLLNGLMGSIRSGIFISLTMADAIIADYDFCANEMDVTVDSGDYRIMRCINELSETRLTIERELRPMHFEGDQSGIFESGRPPLSIYERRSEASSTDANLTTMHSIADVCPTCFLQRWRFKDDVILTSGFSIAKYHDSSLKGANLGYVEATWIEPETDSVWPMHSAEHVVGPIRPALQLDQQKLQHRLIHSKRLEDGSVRQVYHRKAVTDGPDDVLELLWQKA